MIGHGPRGQLSGSSLAEFILAGSATMKLAGRPAAALGSHRGGPQPAGIWVQTENELRLALRYGASNSVPKQRRYLTAFLSPAPAENLGTREAAIWILSPVAGLRPSRAER